jgi:hypothetical protein
MTKKNYKETTNCTASLSKNFSYHLMQRPNDIGLIIEKTRLKASVLSLLAPQAISRMQMQIS